LLLFAPRCVSCKLWQFGHKILKFSIWLLCLLPSI